MLSSKQLEFKINQLEKKNQELAHSLSLVLQRNAKVEANKAWEISIFRRFLIAILTYLIIWLYLVFVVGLPNPFINALVPTIGFILSTLSLDLAKSLWIKHIYKK